jgi:MFS family permease
LQSKTKVSLHSPHHPGYSTFLVYIALIASVPLFVAITFKSMRVLPSHPTNPPFQLTLRDAVACYAMTPTSHGVLFWITASYFFLSAALQWERFLFFFVRDCVTATIPAAKAVASVAYFICLIASACGALCYGAFACSHRFGDRRCWLVSTFGLCAMTVLMITIHTPVQLYCISLVFGAFNGFFLSSSFSLAVQHIPHGQQESLRCSTRHNARRAREGLGWGGGRAR